MSDPQNMQIEQRLIRLGQRLDLPASPDIADRVAAELEAGPIGRPGPRRSWWLRPGFATAAAVVLLVAGALVVSPTTRDAVADWIGLDGLRVEYGRKPARPLGSELLLGDRTTLQGARETAGFEIGVPAALGPPDEVYVAREEPGSRISLVYEADDELPRTETTRVGLLLTAFRARIDDEMILKKSIGAGLVEQVDVGGAPGYWFTGEPHVLFYIDENGEFSEDRARLAGNTLAWQAEGLVYRLESSLSKQRALEIARSVP